MDQFLKKLKHKNKNLFEIGVGLGSDTDIIHFFVTDIPQNLL